MRYLITIFGVGLIFTGFLAACKEEPNKATQSPNTPSEKQPPKNEKSADAQPQPQTSEANQTNHKNVSLLYLRALSTTADWQLATVHGKNEDTISLDEAIREYKTNNPPEKLSRQGRKEIEFVIQAASGLKYLKGITNKPFPLKGEVVSVQDFGQGECLLFGPVFMDFTLNTLRASPKERASKVATDNIVPFLRHIHSDISKTSYKWVGLSLKYGAKNFGQDDEFLIGEFVCLISSVADIDSLEKDEITLDEFLRKARIYQRTRDSDLARIEITLK